jgi:hypothetical protein
MKRIALGLSMGFLIGLLAAPDVWAQATAQVSGTVKDQTGAVLPGVEVTATQTDTGIARSTVTNETGSYVLPNLATGPYRVEATLPGFRTFVQTGIVLQVNSNPVINPVLEVGQVSEQIEVQANAAQVETRATGVGSVIENTRVFQVRENQRLEFRAESFNVTNSTRFRNPAANLNALNTFGLITQSEDARVMQFALKYVF